MASTTGVTVDTKFGAGKTFFSGEGLFVLKLTGPGMALMSSFGATLYVDQLAYTNDRIREIIGGLLALPEAERPIIILQADEGPETPEYRATRKTTWDWDEATPEELETKFGILNAWYVPGDRDVGLYPTQTSINTFPLLFRDYFGLDYDLRPDRVFASRIYTRPYDLIEVTDRLPTLK